MKSPFKTIIVFVFLVPHYLMTNAQETIRFENKTWKAVMEKARKENKLIFLDCYTIWCGPCKWMEKHVFSNDTAAGFYNSNFICVKIDMEKNEGFDLAKKYAVTVYPTQLYLNAAGEILHRTCGAAPVSAFVQDAKDALNPEKRLAYFEKTFRETPTDPKNSFYYFEQLENACLMDQKIVQGYFERQADSALSSFYNWQLILKYAEYASRPFRYLEANRGAFSKRYTSDSVDMKINRAYAIELQQALEKRDVKSLKRLKANLLKLNTKGGSNVISRAERKLKSNLNADMKHATLISDSVIGPVNISKGYGAVLDFIVDPLYKEENSIWFKLPINRDTLLSFDLVPIDSLDDYDFNIFKCETGDCVKEVNTRTLKPVRACLSYCTSKSGVTGLSSYSTKTFIDMGPGPAFVSAIPVKAGETYYIEVDYSKSYIKANQIPMGFYLYFYNYWPRKKPIALREVLFDPNEAALTKTSFQELDKLVLQMKKNQMKIEVQGHTDNSGNEAQNQVLSEERAKAVIDYLVSKNISKDRLFYKGYGSTKPMASNESDEGRRQNRRVEFLIVMY